MLGISPVGPEPLVLRSDVASPTDAIELNPTSSRFSAEFVLGIRTVL